MAKILVIGAGGFMGRHVTRALSKSGHTVIALDKFKPADTRHVLEWHETDSHDLNYLKQAAESCRAAVYLGGYSRPGDRVRSIVESVPEELIHPAQVAEACADVGVRRFVFTSSGGTVYGPVNKHPTPETETNNPLNAYGVAKLATEHFLRLLSASSVIATSVLRVSNPYGPGQLARRGQGFIAAAMHAAYSGAELEIWGDGSVIRDFIYVGDVASAFVAASESGNSFDLVNVSHGAGTSLREICDGVEKASGRRLNVKYTAARAADVPVSVLDNTRAREILNWRPQTPLHEGLAQTAAWWQQQQRGDCPEPTSTSAPRLPGRSA